VINEAMPRNNQRAAGQSLAVRLIRHLQVGGFDVFSTTQKSRLL